MDQEATPADTYRVHSRMQMPASAGPDIYRPWKQEDLLRLHTSFFFHHHDLCRFHQMYSMTSHRTEQAIRQWSEEYRHAAQSADEDVFKSDEEREYQAVRLARIREQIRASELELDRTRAFADHLFIVALWATVEQYASRVLDVAERLLGGGNREIPYRWGALSERLRSTGVAPNECASYEDVNECRILNNKIKHLGLVDRELTQFRPFSGHEGQPLEEVPLDLQRYADGVFEFVGDLMERVDRVITGRH